VPRTDAQAEAKLASTPQTSGGDTTVSNNQIINETAQNGAAPIPSSPIITGPTTPIEVDKQTTINPDGTKTVTTQTVTPTYNNDNSVTTTQTTTTNNYDSQNNLTSTTSTSSAPLPAENSDQQTDCDKYPDSVGCSEYGDVPQPDEIPITQVPMSLSPTSLGSGSCPAPQLLDLQGQPDITLSYDRYCSFASSVSPLVIAFAWLSAGLLVMGGVKE
jgi:hypothetical protein